MVIYSRRKQIFRQSIIVIKITNNLRKKDIDNYNNELRGIGGCGGGDGFGKAEEGDVGERQ